MTKEFGKGTAWGKPYPVMGEMERKDVSTSLIELQNLTLRNFVRRLNRKTICFSKKPENLRAALSLHFFSYNFGRIHGTLSCTPAMEAGLARSVWSVDRSCQRGSAQVGATVPADKNPGNLENPSDENAWKQT